MSFDRFEFHPGLYQGLEDAGFFEPTPIQEKAIPPIMEGRDLLACAMTGSGKTAAFLLPIFHRLLTVPGAGVRVLVLTPTRELAVQIIEHADMLAYHTPARSAVIVGGMSMDPQERALKGNVPLIVATPGRLMDHMRFPYVDFSRVEVLVLDEADRMLDMGFLPDVQRIIRALPREGRQNLLFSATIPRPIAELSAEILRDPVRIDIERPSAPAEGIAHTVFPVPQERKQELLIGMIRSGRFESVLVFTRTKERAERLARFLKRCGAACAALHGDRSQEERLAALNGFKSGRYPVLVATDIAARGLDITALGHVVNLDVPRAAEDYIHRVGRTARAGATGEAFTFVAPDEERTLAFIQKKLKLEFRREGETGFAAAPRPADDHPHTSRKRRRPRRRPRSAPSSGGG
jgi:ATP-dependent RNA helicase RhlE